MSASPSKLPSNGRTRAPRPRVGAAGRMLESAALHAATAAFLWRLFPLMMLTHQIGSFTPVVGWHKISGPFEDTMVTGNPIRVESYRRVIEIVIDRQGTTTSLSQIEYRDLSGRTVWTGRVKAGEGYAQTETFPGEFGG